MGRSIASSNNRWLDVDETASEASGEKRRKYHQSLHFGIKIQTDEVKAISFDFL